jgi:sulfur-oxidizing protein SoxX
MRNTTFAFAAVAVTVAGCAAMTPEPVGDADVVQILKGSFRAKGIAALDRLDQSQMQKECTHHTTIDLPNELRKRIEHDALAAVKYPADGKYVGDWKRGEAIAQSGRGMQYSDEPGAPNGGNCYACHRVTAEEIAFGNTGPSLFNYGKLRGTSEPILKYTWAKIWNSHSFNACSQMPRFGDAGILTADQIRDVMALLLDPASPVNR